MGNALSFSRSAGTDNPELLHSPARAQNPNSDLPLSDTTPTGKQPVSRSLKRARPPEVADNKPSTPIPTTGPIDATPDGDSHRHIVTCEAVFFSDRKQLVKILRHVVDMPPYTSIQKAPKSNQFIINFPNAACASHAVTVLSSHTHRKKPFSIKPAPKDRAPKRRRFEDGVRNEAQQPEGHCLTAADVTAALRALSYDEQLKRKQGKLLSALQRVLKRFRADVPNADSLPWVMNLLNEKQHVRNPLCCPLEELHSAAGDACLVGRQHYRNKNEFTIGMSPSSCGLKHTHHIAKPVIGYSLGNLREGHISVGAVDDTCLTTSLRAIEVANLLTPVVAQSGLPIYDRWVHSGFWRQIVVRESMRLGGFLVIIGVKAMEDDGSVEGRQKAREEMERAQGMVLHALKGKYGDGSEFGLFWQTTADIAGVSATTPVQHIYGLEVLYERVCGLKFRIQPLAFFQVNTVMAEKLYELIGEVANIDDDTVVLDLCCGTGTIGLSLAKRAHSVVGIELVQGAVEDARHNAAMNDICNATFLAGKVEDRIHEAVRLVGRERKCVVVLDPPRAGVANSVLAAVRATRVVERVVYVSCAPENLHRNAAALCRPTSKAFRSEPFKPVKAYGVDLFPHTEHAEMITLFERASAGEAADRPSHGGRGKE